MGHNCYVVILWLLLQPWWVFSQTSRDNFHHITVENGLPSMYVHDMLQDSSGYIWFATESGVCKYDGYQALNHTVSEGLSKNDVRQLFRDQRDKIWILPRGPLCSYQDQKIQIEQLEFVQERRVYDMLEDHSNRLWFNTGRNLYYQEPNGQVGEIRGRNLQSTGILHLEFEDLHHQLWVYVGGGTFALIAEDAVKRRVKLTLPLQSERGALATQLLSDGTVLYAAAEGLGRIHPDGRQDYAYQMPEGTYMDSLMEVMVDRSGDLWLGSKNGLFRLQAQGEGWSLAEHLLAGVPVSHLFQDQEGNIWISTLGEGVYMLSRHAAEVVKRHTELTARDPRWSALLQSQVTAFAPIDDHARLVGTAAGELFYLSLSESNTQLAVWKSRQQADHGAIRQLLALPDQKWLAAMDSGLIMGQAQTWTRLYGPGEVRSLALDQTGHILLGTSGMKDYRLSLAQLEQFKVVRSTEQVEDSLRDSEQAWDAPSTHILQVDAAGSYWVAWPKGLYRLQEGVRIEYFDSLPDFRAKVFALAPSPDSLMWIATNGSGLVIVGRETYQVLDAQKGLQGAVCYALYVDAKKSEVWVGTNRGVACIGPYDWAGQAFKIRWFDQLDGIKGNEVRKLFKLGEDLFMATDRGLSVLSEGDIQADDYPPPVYLTQLWVEDREMSIHQALQLAHHQNTLEIHYTGISYRNLGRLRFQYRINDDPWQETYNTSLRLPSLSAGDYAFQVRAIGRDGPASLEPKTLRFTIKPVFYKTWWFIGAVLLLLGALGLGFLRFVYAERQRILLEARVDEKTYELNQKVEELHRTNQDLQQFAYVASHDLKTPLRTVIGHLQLLARRYKGKLDPEADEFIIYAVEGAKRMYAMINHLLDYARLGREKPVFEPVDLNRILRNVEMALQATLEEKKAKIIYEALPLIEGVSSQWETLFQNLIENGIKFNRSTEPTVWIQYKDSPDYWILSVSDNGIGIEEEYQVRIFELFQRLHTTEFSGTGIGLAMCKRIVEVHGGSMWIESEPGKGTTFFFTIAKQMAEALPALEAEA